MDSLIALVLLTIFTGQVHAGEYCVTERYDHGAFYTYQYEYCNYGCCGSYPNHDCCGTAVWLIIVAVVASLIFVSCIIAVICCFVKKKNRNGVVIHPQQNSHIAVVTAGPSMGYQPYPQPQPGGAYPPPVYQPPQVGFHPPPPAYGAPYPPPPGAPLTEKH